MPPQDPYRQKKRPADLSLPPTGKRETPPRRPVAPRTPPPRTRRPVAPPRTPPRARRPQPPQDQRGVKKKGKGAARRRPSGTQPPKAGNSGTAKTPPTKTSPAKTTPSVLMVGFLQRFVLYTVRLLILGVGLGAIAGTFLSTIQSMPSETTSQQTVNQQNSSQSNHPLREFSNLPQGEKIEPLQGEVERLAEQFPKYELGVFLLDLDTGNYVDWNGRRAFASASTIKMPILVAFFQEVDAGTVRLDESLVMQEAVMVGEAGTMQYDPPGTRYSALETVEKMIRISDNTATNMIIQRLGGREKLNQSFAEWGLRHTMLRNGLPDLEGLNKTSPVDLTRLLVLLNRGELVDLRSRDRLLSIMGQVENRDLLVSGLGEGASIAHKTGNIGTLVADAGLVDTPTGKRYILAVMVKRPYNDQQAKALIQQISKAAYEYFSQPIPNPDTTKTPLDTTGTIAIDELGDG
ncbi:class A beta-lactamase-related serine hydrolase [Spirulina sp. CS-785/01]|uniref:serine hydrolase n=1 Tax=Spirulina sp. CS-785/01 TaxID=3021716 RepID=UPI00232F83E3|nr:serine hydrolase [Spirulina sp. CS-785/01]MDB9312736.1 class A beta-lactamase-related serine hydrolase [Spirulina sp. CS-785/01]